MLRSLLSFGLPICLRPDSPLYTRKATAAVLALGYSSFADDWNFVVDTGAGGAWTRTVDTGAVCSPSRGIRSPVGVYS